MTSTFARWPFASGRARTPQETDRWWRECYVPAPAITVLCDTDRSVVLTGCAGSGKSVSVAALAREAAEQVLTVPYPVTRWPGSKTAWLSEGHHLRQIMACASLRVRQVLAHNPQKLAALSAVKLEFLRWLIEKHAGPRALRRWADEFQVPAAEALSSMPFDDLYPTDTTPNDAQGQIEELVQLARALGYNSVAVLIDLDETQTEANRPGLLDLFGWLEPLQHRGLALKASLPESEQESVTLSRGRAALVRLRWSRESCAELAERHIRAATQGSPGSLPELADADLLGRLADEVEAIFGAPTPRGWVGLAVALLELHETSGKREPASLFDAARSRLYARSAPLRLDKEREGVWRGRLFISLKGQRFEFLKALWDAGSGIPDKALLEVAGSQPNINTLADRVREQIEPTPEAPIYLCSKREQGYWLENVVRPEHTASAEGFAMYV